MVLVSAAWPGSVRAELVNRGLTEGAAGCRIHTQPHRYMTARFIILLIIITSSVVCRLLLHHCRRRPYSMSVYGCSFDAYRGPEDDYRGKAHLPHSWRVFACHCWFQMSRPTPLFFPFCCHSNNGFLSDVHSLFNQSVRPSIHPSTHPLFNFWRHFLLIRTLQVSILRCRSWQTNVSTIVLTVLTRGRVRSSHNESGSIFGLASHPTLW